MADDEDGFSNKSGFSMLTPAGVADVYIRKDGAKAIETHSPVCERTKAVREAFVRGDSCPPPAPRNAAPCFKGPAQVANEAYRMGWDNIFGRKNAVGEA